MYARQGCFWEPRNNREGAKEDVSRTLAIVLPLQMNEGQSLLMSRIEDSTHKAYWHVHHLVALEQGEVLDASRDPLIFVLEGRRMEILSTKVEHSGMRSFP